MVFFWPISLPNCSVLYKTYLEPLPDKMMNYKVVAKDKTSNPDNNDFVQKCLSHQQKAVQVRQFRALPKNNENTNWAKITSFCLPNCVQNCSATKINDKSFFLLLFCE